MNQFKNFGIKVNTKGLEGDKIKIERVLNRDITVQAYKIVTSKFSDKGNGRCLHLQILMGEMQYVVFSGSGVLMELIEQVPKDKFPFTTRIVQENKRLEFI